MTTHLPSHLTDDELVHEVERLVGCERQATARLLAHLAVFDERRLYLPAGFSSMFTYCVGFLRFSEHAAYNRIAAARAAREYPAVLDRLADGSVNLTTVKLLAGHLTAENHERLLREATHKTKEQVEELVVRIAPRPVVASRVRKVPVRAPASSALAANALPLAESQGATVPATPPPRPAVVAPLAPDRYEIRFTATGATRQKLRHAQDLLRHAVPSGDVGEIFDRALTLLIEDLERRKYASTEKPRAGRPGTPHSRHIPAAVRRAVRGRDAGRCAFVGGGGRRCEARGRLEFHHLDPYAAGGEASLDRIELRCAAHNRYESDLYFGPIRRARAEDEVREPAMRYLPTADPATRSRTSCVSSTQ